MVTRGRGKALSIMTRMIVAFFSGFEFGGAFKFLHFEIFVFIAFAQIIELIELIFSIPLSQKIVESFLGCWEFDASFDIRMRPPREPPDKQNHTLPIQIALLTILAFAFGDQSLHSISNDFKLLT